MRHSWSVVTAALVAFVVAGRDAAALTLTVQGSDNGPVGHYRWLVEEDNTHPVTIGALVADSLGVSIHNTFAPVVAAGTSDDLSPITNLSAAGRYYISIRPDAGYGMGGGQIAAGQSAATILVNHLPIPTAQMLVFVFEDTRSISGAAEIPAEHGLANFSIRIDEILGHQVWDVFGNPLGTTYVEPLPTDGSPPTVAVLGNGINTGPDGFALIKNVPPGNYKVTARPRDGQPWKQTTAVGGGPFIPVAVKAGEPPFLDQGLGVLNMHAAIGFVRPFNDLAPGGTGTITGRCVNEHSPHPPSAVIVAGTPVKDCLVGLNSVEAGTEVGKYFQPANPDGTFTIQNVPAGAYQIALVDEALDNLISNYTLDVPAGGTIALGDALMARWTSTFEGSVFRDDNADGIRQPGEPGIAGTTINIRFPDASIIQSTQTDDAGNFLLPEVPPLGEWTIAEVDYARLKVTGATFSADQGADRPPDVHTETQGLVLLEAQLTQANQVNHADFGKKAYGPGPDNVFNTADDENGGIVGITYYATTRAEDDPYLGVGDPWEPGIPRVQENLYLDANHDGTIDDLDGDGIVTLADVDNFPYQWTRSDLPGYTGAPGPEDVDRPYPGHVAGVFDPGDAVAITISDGFNDLAPTGCAGAPQFVHNMPIQDCAADFFTWNQMRPGAFDGGFYFPSFVPGGLANVAGGIPNWGAASIPLRNGVYILEAVPPPGYEITKEEDKNVTIGDSYQPSPQALLFPCVGDPHLVPPVLSGDGATPGYYAGQTRPLCDRKQVTLTPGLNANCDFFLFTQVPKAGRIVGEVQNLLANQTNPNTPNFGGPQTPPWMPVSIQDYAGHEIGRVYTDEFGEFNALVPGSNSPHVPQPSGLASNVVNLCINHPGPIIVGGNPVTDPRYDPNYDQPCYRAESIQGKTTYVVTPVTAISAFVAAPTGLDCELQNHSPVIAQVTGGPSTTTGSNITITSPGSVMVPDPADPSGATMITRDYGFGGSAGRVTVGGRDLTNLVWAADGLSIQATVPVGVTTGELLVHRADGPVTAMGITLTVNDLGPSVTVQPNQTIQAAIDAAPANALVLVPPGTYHENLIIWKPIRLQGYGAYSTIIDASVFPVRSDAWRAKLAALVHGNLVDLVPGQRADLALEDGAGITVLAKDGDFTSANRARIDGFTVTGAVRGGGVFVNGYAHYLEVSNNRLQANQGSTGGGIRLGWQSLVNDTNTGYESAANDHLSIHHNHLIRNGSLGDGGGILIFNGADHYAITANRFCGNYGAANGGAISHFGLSDQGLIADNDMFMNEGFGEGGGISLIGEFVPTGAPPGFLSEGTGTITIDSNRIQSNYGGDDGGGITMFSTSGQDIATHPGDPAHWYHIDIVNNIITNNVCGFSGAGIAMSDAVGVRIVHNTITHNDSTSVANFTNGSVTLATPMSGGIIARPNSPDLAAASGQPFTNPVLLNNIIWHNRSFVYDATLNGGLGGLFADPTSPYWDLQVFGMPAGTRLDPHYCLLSEDLASGDPHNSGIHYDDMTNIYPSDAKLVAPFDNSIEVTPNVLTPLVSPLSPIGNYHIQPTSPAVDTAGAVAGNFGTLLAADFDADVRPNGVADIGADEVPPGAAGPSDTVGPKIRDLLASPNPTGGAATVSVTGTAYDTATGGSSVTAAEWWTSSIPAHTPITGSFGSMEVALAFTVPVTTNSDFTVFVRAQDAFGNWGDTASVLVVWSASAPADTVGPSINALKADPNPSNGAPTTTVTATVFDTLSGNSNVDAAEYWTTAVAPPPGGGTPMTAADGSFNSAAEKVTVTLAAAGPDFFVHVRGHDAAGNWGAPATIQVRVTPGNSGTGPGRGIFIQCPGDADGDAVIDAAVVPPAGPYSYPSNARCKSLSAGDGHIMMADGQPMFTLGFSDLTGVPPDQAAATGVSAANFPAPKIVVDEDDDFYLNLTNVGMATRPDLFDPHTVHWHGFPNAASIFDGLPDASIGIGMGSTLTYFYHVKEPGTYMYHCHQEAAEHMQMGMLGNLYVRPKQNRLPDGYCFTTHTVGPCAAAATHHNPDYNVNRNLDNPEIGDKYAYDDGDGSTRYDVDYAIQIGSMDPNFHDLHERVQPLPFAEMRDLYPMLNGRGYPDTINPASIANPDGHPSQNDSSKITATPGQKILLRISNLSVTRYYTLGTLGIPMKVVGFNARVFRSPSTNNGTTPGKSLAYTTNSVTLGGGETIDVILDTAGVPNGTYFLYTTNLNYLTNNEEEFGGMMTEITVAP